LLGTGAGDCSDELQKVYQRNDFDIAYHAQYNPHNQYLQVLLTLGPAGLLFFMALFGTAIYRARIQKNFTLFLLAYIFAASMITESMLERQTGMFLFSVLMAFFAAIPEKADAKTTSGEG
jgi:O-antigen ligase